MNIKRPVKRIYASIPNKAKLFEPLRRIGLPETVFRHLHFVGPFAVDVDGRSFRLDHTGSSFENELFWRGLSAYEPGTLALWRSLVRTAPVIIDAGAHSGLFSLIAASLNQEARVIAFEPEPRVYQRLLANLAINDLAIVPERIALSDATGTATFYVGSGDNHPVTSSLAVRQGEMMGNEVRQITVPAMRLDDYVFEREIERVSLVKLDVERHEGAVLRGMRRIVERDRPYVIAEALDELAGDEILASIAGMDYECLQICDPSGELAPVERIRPERIGQNYLLRSLQPGA